MIKKNRYSSSFITFLLIFEIGIFFAFGFWFDYDSSYYPETTENDPRVEKYFTFFSDTTVLALMGFGFLLVYLRNYCYSASGFSFLLVAFAFQWNLLVYAFFYQMHIDIFGKFKLDIETLGRGIYGSLCALISFGAFLGTTQPTQILMIIFIEIFFYQLNYYINIFKLQAFDMGGSIYLHEFAGIFGYAVTLGLGSRKDIKKHPDIKSRYNSDIFSIFGTMWLWIAWPSFNAMFSPTGFQFRSLLNTIMAISSSVIAAFAVSIGVRGKFHMREIRNATLTGGIAIAAASHLKMSLVGSMICGIIAGALTSFLSAILTKSFRVFYGGEQIRRILFFHAIPGIIGGFASAFGAGLADEDKEPYKDHYHEFFPRGDVQYGAQLAAMGITLLIALISGYLTGLIINEITFRNTQPLNDSEYWHVPDDFEETTIDSLGIPRDHKGNVVGDEWVLEAEIK
ncbi:rh50 isoform b [Anaeramoeba ignava]|uniref:Rh50 isoform b n=1 Tax=Anaeramoeba ignava TaxID=1746090 RepID=A0A9Q0LVT1_ANAIG|nr:rh50 isoform b [Anaeramoeba ignava]|eukprot:Anaeramoba_ignava/c19094_g2_i1.p1 GENE.c19094_g2_i1~~c19094_g2_i1.p1  ORF type:complete len:454 (-),score=138.72 c19094_g2_i1:22-1383(-)